MKNVKSGSKVPENLKHDKIRIYDGYDDLLENWKVKEIFPPTKSKEFFWYSFGHPKKKRLKAHTTADRFCDRDREPRPRMRTAFVSSNR